MSAPQFEIIGASENTSQFDDFVPVKGAAQKKSSTKHKGTAQKKGSFQASHSPNKTMFAKTAPCARMVIGIKHNHANCNWAHSMEEWNPIQCRNGEDCLNSYCEFMHPSETKELYIGSWTKSRSFEKHSSSFPGFTHEKLLAVFCGGEDPYKGFKSPAGKSPSDKGFKSPAGKSPSDKGFKSPAGKSLSDKHVAPNAPKKRTKPAEDMSFAEKVALCVEFEESGGKISSRLHEKIGSAGIPAEPEPHIEMPFRPSVFRITNPTAEERSMIMQMMHQTPQAQAQIYPFHNGEKLEMVYEIVNLDGPTLEQILAICATSNFVSKPSVFYPPQTNI